MAACARRSFKRVCRVPEWLQPLLRSPWPSPIWLGSCRSASASTASCSGHGALCRRHSSPAHTPAATHAQATARLWLSLWQSNHRNVGHPQGVNSVALHADWHNPVPAITRQNDQQCFAASSLTLHTQMLSMPMPSFVLCQQQTSTNTGSLGGDLCVKGLPELQHPWSQQQAVQPG